MVLHGIAAGGITVAFHYCETGMRITGNYTQLHCHFTLLHA